MRSAIVSARWLRAESHASIDRAERGRLLDKPRTAFYNAPAFAVGGSPR